MIFSHKINIFAIFSGYNLLIYHLILFTKTIVSILCDVDSKMYKKYLELKWDRLYSTLRLEGSDLRSNRKILILKRSFSQRWKNTAIFGLQSFKKPQKPRTEAIQEKIVKVSSLPISFNSVKDKDYNSVSSFTVELQLLDDYVGQIVT